MTARRLRELLKEGEGPRVEFKRAEIKASDLAESMAAMANTGGGWILLGVSDYGVPIGVDSRKDALDLVTIAARDCVKPVVAVTSSEVQLPRGHLVVAVRVSKSRQPVVSSSGRVLLRQGSRNVPATPDELGQLFGAAKTGQQDAFPYEILAHNVVLEILDPLGENAILTRTAKVRFLQDEVLALHDRVWGEGELNLNGYFKPGTVVDRFSSKGELHQLVSLREPKHRGDLATIEVVHRVKGVFGDDREWFDVDVDMPTQFLRVELWFPTTRAPKAAWLTEDHGALKTQLSGSNIMRRTGPTRIVWRRSRPTLHERFRTEWTW